MNKNTKQAKVLQDADIIIWDEFSMVPGKALYYVNNLLKDIMNSDSLFGDKVLICGGDFRQILPVEEVGSSIIASTVKGLKLWDDFEKTSLTVNMRVSDDNVWANFLLDLGVGKYMNLSIGKVNLPERMFTKNIVRSVFGDKICSNDTEALSTRVILAPKNITVNHLNEEILDILEGDDRIYNSIDLIR
ncbi:unnamed protein product [Auanema sp. JU1783]|nr:unnamed protein product [Auanema sp. JU1783]